LHNPLLLLSVREQNSQHKKIRGDEQRNTATIFKQKKKQTPGTRGARKDPNQKEKEKRKRKKTPTRKREEKKCKKKSGCF
jgi:hypothetical protein